MFRIDNLRVAIFSYLPIKNILNVESVSSQFLKSARANFLWKEKLKEIGIHPSTIKAVKDLRKTCIQTIQMRAEFINQALITANTMQLFLLVQDTYFSVDIYKNANGAYYEIFNAQLRAADMQGAFKTATRIGKGGHRDQAFLKLVKILVQAGDIQRAFQAVKKIKGCARDKACLELVKGQVQASDMRGAFKTINRICDRFLQVEAYLKIGQAQAQIDTRNANRTYQKAIKTVNKIKSTQEKIQAYFRIAIAQVQIDISEAFKTAEMIESPFWKSKAYCEIEKQIQIDSLAAAGRTYKRTLQTADQIKDSTNHIRTYCEIDKEQAHIDQLGAADTCERALQRANRIRDPLRQLQAYCEIAKVQAQTDIQAAARTSQRALQTAKSIDNFTDRRVKAYLMIADFYVQMEKLDLGNGQ